MRLRVFVLLFLATASSCAHRKLYPLEVLCWVSGDDHQMRCMNSKGVDYQLSPKDQKQLLCVPQAEFKAYAEACHSQ